MDLLGTKTKAQLQEMTSRYASAEEARSRAERTAERVTGEAQEMLKKAREVQELLVDDILTIKTRAETYVGNDYPAYDVAVQAISDKYNSKADWGCLQTGTIVDLRAAFILGEGFQPYAKTDTKEEAKSELQWVKDFIDFNNLDGEMAQEIAKETEIEGKVLLRLFWKAEKYREWPGMVSVRFVSWTDKKYKIVADKNDYLDYKQATWTPTGGDAPVTIPAEEFVYKKFGGRLSSPNEAQPKVMKCLTEIDRLDKALRDFRDINHLFASPTPDFQVETAQQATALLQFIKDKNWRIGKAFAHIGKFSMIGPDAAGVQSLEAEIELNTKLISGTTGVPIHYLGMLDLLKNRATGDNTRELVMAATTRERSIWVGGIEELITKAMQMYNLKTGSVQKSTEGGKLDPTKVGVRIPLISQDHWANLEKVLIPAALGGIISKDFVAGQIPGVDLEEEQKKREEQEAKDEEAAQAALDQMKQEAALNKPKVKPGQAIPEEEQ